MLEHDTAVLDKLGDVMVGTTIIENDWALKWQNALGGIASLEGKVEEIDALPQELPDHGAQITALQSTADSIETKVDALGGKVDSILANLFDLLEASKVHIEILESPRLFNADRAFLMLLTENGNPVDADVAHVFALSDVGQEATAVEVDWVSVPIRAGLVQVDVSMRRSHRSSRIFLIQVEHYHGGGIPHHGSKLVSLETTEAR